MGNFCKYRKGSKILKGDRGFIEREKLREELRRRTVRMKEREYAGHGRLDRWRLPPSVSCPNDNIDNTNNDIHRYS